MITQVVLKSQEYCMEYCMVTGLFR